ncbi:RidA family protein [Parasphingorhabdus flavimaris]|uniref:RidA family protein n=1 Tax=Parasphingorhabdus flavimaris TaxID=266812 RepID=A0ABX2N5R3_9SPHN|nr:RidA family protein [Parasphingorhabdus flavimaris]NVD28871.1 RidA family protein [Parasphingorhabdus flavimaris]|tara:strand:- start:8343 stop:8810 length:468 start_codon:yes stop_codon:yes gene_type:complete
MTDNIESALTARGIELPTPAAPVASYVPAVEAGGLLYISGQVSMSDGKLITGRLGDDMSLEEGQQAAKACALMIAAQIKKAAGSLDRVDRIVKLGVFVNSTAEYTDHPKVANGCSDMMAVIFGAGGQHARSAVGVSSLPLGVAVEVDAIIALKPE